MAGFSNDIMFADNVNFAGGKSATVTTDGQLLIGSTASPNIRVGTITSPLGTLSIGYSSPNITLDLAGGSTGIDSIATDSGASPVFPNAAGLINIFGTHNNTTIGSLNTVTIQGTNSITLGDLSVIAAGSNAIDCDTGDINLDSGNIKLPNTNAALTRGVISWTSTRIHNFGTNNVFFGGGAGNGTLTSQASIGIGTSSLASLTSGSNNIAIGVNAGQLIQNGADNLAVGVSAMTTATSGSSNTAIGRSALRLLATTSNNTAVGFEALRNVVGASNTALGYQAGTSYTGVEANNIVIGAGVNGTLGESGVTRIGAAQTVCFIDGIDGVNVGSVATVVTEASDQLGTAVITAGSGITVTASANAITIAAEDGGFTWNDTSGAFSPLKNNGYFITGTATGTLPASPSQGDTIQFFVDHATQDLTIQAAGAQTIRMGSLISTGGGTALSTSQGDAVELVYRTSNNSWQAVDFVGTWVLA